MQIVNSVFTANLDRKFNLFLINKLLYNSIYKPHRFSGLIFKVGRITIVLFSSGHVNILGCKSIKKAEKVGRKLAKILDGNLKNFKVANLVVTENLGKRVNLTKLGNLFLEFDRKQFDFSFEPELMAAFIWRMKTRSMENEKEIYKKKLTAMIFHTGKVNYTGEKDFKEIENASMILKDLFIKHQIFFEQ